MLKLSYGRTRKDLKLFGVGEAHDLFIKEGNVGLFFEPENHIELAASINKLLDDPKRIIELGENGRKYVSQKFDRNLLATNFNVKLQEIFNEKK